MKKKIFLHWDSDIETPSSGNDITIEIDFADLVEVGGDSEAEDVIEGMLKKFGEELRVTFDADSSDTEKTRAELEAWCDEQAKNL